MNILELQDNLKDLPDSALMREMQMPSGSAPQFLVLSELKRRKRMRDEFKRQEASNMPTVAEEVVTAAGVPQEGIMGAARAMAPNTNMAQNTGMDTAAPVPATRAPQMMADGGVVKMQQGGGILSTFSPAIIDLSLSGTYGLDTQREIAGLAITGQFGSEKQAQVLSEALSGAYGDDIKRRAEQANALLNPQTTPQITTSDPSSGFFPNDANLATVGGEGIGSVSADVEDFTATDTNYTGQGGTLPAELIPMQSMLASDPVTRIQADRAGISVDEYISQMSPEARAQNLLRASGQGPEFDKGAELAAYGEFIGTPSMYRPEAGMPTQEDLDLRAQEAAAKDVFPEYVSPNDQDREYNAMQELKRQAAIERGGYEAAARAEDAPTFTGDVLPFLGDASVAAGKSLYNSLFPQKTVGPDDVIAELREQEAMRNADPIQDEINRLRAIISNPDASAPEKANAADDLVKLQERIAVTQTGGNIAATVEGQGIELEAPYIMGPFGPMIDPNYKSPGKTGQSIVDQAALQGSEALQELADTGLYPDSIIREAEKAATLSDFEQEINVINKDIMDVQNNLKNPYLPDDARAELETFLKTAQQQKNELVNQTGVDKLFVPPSVENVPSITGGYEGLIDTSPVTIAEQAAEAAEDAIDMDALTAEADEERAGYEAAAKALQEVEKDPDAPKVPKVDPDPAGFGSTDSRIAKMLSERQKQAESDKWMALAQAGFQIMASKSPTLLGAVGEGGQAGLKALSASKKGMRDFETDMLKLETQLAAARLRSQGTGKTSATAYAALERAYSDALTAATQNPTAPNLARLEELEAMIREARSAQFGTVTAGNTNSGVIKTPSAQT